MRKKRLLMYAIAIAMCHLLPPTVCPVAGQTTAGNSLLWSEAFNTAKVMPDGWTIAAGNVSISSEAYHGSAGWSLLLKTDDSAPAMVASPQTSHSANDIYFKAWVKVATGTKYQIGLTDDIADESAYMPLYFGEAATDEWTEIRFSTADYGTADANTAFVIFLPAGTSAELYVDDITVEPTPQCMRPENLAVDAVDATSVTLSWGGQSGVGQHQVSLTPDGGTEVIRDVTGSPAKVDGLTANTSYTAKVRAVCSAGETSEWSPAVTFQTVCGTTESVVQMHNFDASNQLPVCWLQKQTVKGNCLYGGEDHGDNAWSIGSDRFKSGSNALCLKKSCMGTHTILALQPMNVDEANKYKLTFEYYRGYSGDGDGVAVYVNDRPDIDGGQKLGFISTAIWNEPEEDSYDEGWYRYEFMIPKTGVVYVIFEGITDVMTDDNQYIDDIAIEEVNVCTEIDAATIGYRTLDDRIGFEVFWTKAAEETQWIVEYELKSDETTVNDTVVVSEPRCVFDNGLTAGNYSISGRLAAICSETDTSRYISFKRDQILLTCTEEKSVPFTETFETTDRLPLCWISQQTKNGSFTQFPDYGNKAWTTAESPTGTGRAMQHRMSRYDTRTILVSPAFTIPESETWMVEMKVYRDDYERNKNEEGVKVFVNATPGTDGATELLYIQNDRNFAPSEDENGIYTYYAQIPNTGRQYLILEGISRCGRDTYVDDVSIKPMPDCMPIAHNVKYDSVSHNAVRLFIREDAAWEMKYCNRGEDCSNAEIQQSSNGYCHINNLLPDTEYEFDIYARRICSGGVSEWSKSTIAFHTKCQPHTVTAETPFLDNFDNLEVDGTPGNCYESAALGEFEAVDRIGEITPANGGKAVVKANNAAWLYRSVYLKAGVDYRVSGLFASAGSQPASVSMSVATEPDDASVLSRPVENRNVANNWQRVSGYFTIPADGLYYLGWNIGGNRQCAADEVSVSETQCIPPSSSNVLSLKSTSATIWWTSTGGDSWELAVSENDDLSVPVYNKPATSQTALADGLHPDTRYYYSVRSVCNGVPGDWADVASFTTRCGAQKIPVTEDFDDENLTDFRCWLQIDRGGLEYSRSTDRFHSAGASLKIRNGMIVSPELDVASLSEYTITGWVSSESDNAAVSVGVMEDPDDISTFKTISVINIANRGVWQEFTGYFILPDLENKNPKYVVLATSGDDVLYFDDLRITELPLCPKPIEPRIGSVTQNSFALDWKTAGNAHRWLVSVNSTDNHHTFDTVVYRNPSTIEGLLPAKEYNMSIRAICGVGDTTVAVNCGSLTTGCASYSVPYNLYIDDADGSALPQCWSLGVGNTDVQENNWRAYHTGGNAYLRYSDEGSGKYHTLLSPVMDFAGKSYVSMHASVLNSAAAGELTVRLSTDGGTTFPIELGKVLPSDVEQQLDYNLSEYAGNKAVIAFEAHGGTTGSETIIYSFGIDCDEACSHPDSIKLVEAGDKEVSLMLVDDAEEHSAWQAVCGTKGFDYGNAAPQDVVAKLFTIDGLQPLTEYYVYVRTKCSASEFSSWRGPLKVATACPDEVQLPYTENFEYASADELCIDVFNLNADGRLPSMRLQSGNASDGSKCLGLNAGNSTPLYLVFPITDVPLKDVKVKFDYKTPAGSDNDNFCLELGVLADAGNLSSFVPLKQYYRTYREYETVEFDFNTQEQVFAANARIAVRLQPASSNIGTEIMFFDNVSITENVPCSPITRFDILNVEGGSVTASADFRTDSIICVWGAVGTAADACTDSKIIKTKQFTVDGLEPGKSYYMYVRTICADESIKLWSAPQLVSVGCNAIPLAEGERWVENFDAYPDDVLFPQCFSTLLAEEVDGVLYPALDTEYAVKGRGIRFRSENTIALPLFDADADRLKLSFSYHGEHGFVYVALRDNLYSGSQTRIGEGLAPDPDAPDKVQRVTFDLSSYETKGKYIVIYTGEMNSDMTIDSLVVERSATCFAPRNLNVVVGDTLVSASWQKVPDAVGYEYKLVAGNETATGTIDEPALHIDTLKPSTHYSLSIRTICGEDATTDWTEYNFTTLANVTSLPFSTGFEDETDNAKWQYRQTDSGNRFVIGDADNTAVKDGKNALYVSSDGKTNTYDTEQTSGGQHIYRSFYMEQGRYSCSYDWRCIGEDAESYEVDYATVYLVHSAEPLTAGSVIIPDPAVVVVLQDNRNGLSNQSSWKRDYKEFDIETAGYYNIVVSWYNNAAGGTQPPLSLDNLTLDRIDCLPLSSVTLNDVTDRSAWFTAINPNAAGSIEYRLLHDNQVIETDTVADSHISFNNILAPVTDYVLEVRPYCGEGVEMPYIVKEFATAPLDAPTGLVLDAVGQDNAAFSWSGSFGCYNVQILTGTTVVKDTVVSTKSLSVTGLISSSAYLARVRSEDDGFYSAWLELPFCTECGEVYAPYNEDFSYVPVSSLPCCWNITSGSDIAEGKENWLVDDGMLRLSTSQAKGHAEIWSPAINVTDASARLTFDYINTSLYDTLCVKVSTDGGRSFGNLLLEAATTQSLTSAEYNIGGYAGNKIIVAFSVNATQKLQTNYVAVDNFRVACLSQPVTVADSVCPGAAYTDNGFSIPADQIDKSGDYEFTQLIKAVAKDHCDYYGTLRLHVRNGGTHHINASICEGGTYTSTAFPDGISVEGEYTATIKSTDGCDSTIVLTLKVGNPYAEITDTVCDTGLPYIFAGKEYYTSGVYADTVRLPSRCDSITTLHLTVLPTRFEYSDSVCAGETYTWHDYFGADTTLTTPGHYEHRYKNHRGCDSIEVMNLTVLPDFVRIDSTICYGQSVLHGTEIHTTTGIYPVTIENALGCNYTAELHLTVLPPDTTSFLDISCQGKPYFGHGFQNITINSDTLLMRTTPDPEGCISIVRVNIDHIPTVEVFDTVAITAGGAYTFCGNSYNEAGTYTCKEPTSDGCDSITHLTILITTGTDQSRILPLTIAPNPVGIAETTRIHRTWTADEQRGLTLEIINSVGQTLSTEQPQHYPITIAPLRTVGIYYIRITTGTGTIYMGKLIAR